MALGAEGCRPLATGPAAASGASSGTTSTALIGTWRRTLVLQTADDITTSETTWLFGPDGSCERVVATTSVAAGLTHTTRSPCTWSASGHTLTVHYTGAGAAQFTWSVQGATLTLNGQTFQRA